jgi:hypothetical protein
LIHVEMKAFMMPSINFLLAVIVIDFFESSFAACTLVSAFSVSQLSF